MMAQNIGAEILRDTDLERRLLEAVVADRNDQPRSKQLQVGPSEVGGCRELLRAGLFEAPDEAEPETNWAAAAHVGTVMGADLERIFGQRLGALEQTEIVAQFGMLGVSIAGSADLIFLDGDQITDLKSNADIGGLLYDLKRDASAIETLLSIHREGLLYQKYIETANGGYELTEKIVNNISKLHYYVQIAIYVMGAMQQGILTPDGEGRLVFYDRSGGYQGFIALRVPAEQIALFYAIGQLRITQVLKAQEDYEKSGGIVAIIAPLRDKAPSYCFSPKVMCPRREHCWTGSAWTTKQDIENPEHIAAANKYELGRELGKLADGMKKAARDQLKEDDVTGRLPDGKMLTWGANGAINLVQTTVKEPQPQAVLDQFIPPVDLVAEIEIEQARPALAIAAPAELQPEVPAIAGTQDAAAVDAEESSAPRMTREQRYKMLANTGAPVVRRMANEITGVELKGLRKEGAIDAILAFEYPETVPPEAAQPAGEPAASDGEPSGSAFIALVQPELDASATAQHALIEEAMQGGPAGDEAADELRQAQVHSVSLVPEGEGVGSVAVEGVAEVDEQTEARRRMMQGEYVRPPEPQTAPSKVLFVPSDYVPYEGEDPQRPGLFIHGIENKDRLRQMQYDSDEAWRAKLIEQRAMYVARDAQK